MQPSQVTELIYLWLQMFIFVQDSALMAHNELRIIRENSNPCYTNVSLRILGRQVNQSKMVEITEFPAAQLGRSILASPGTAAAKYKISILY